MLRTLLLPLLLLALLATTAGAEEPLRIGKLRCGKVLLLGNSITLHGPAEKIGWTGNWGMAASAADKDYVSLVVAHLATEAGRKPEILVRNIADFERQHTEYDIEKELAKELDFDADLVIVAIGENVPALATKEAQAAYEAAFTKLLAALQKRGEPQMIVRGCFWADATKDAIMKNACLAAGGTFVDISALGKDEANFARAERKIEHAGVAVHPGDKGMQAIAAALIEAIDTLSKK
jgi:hypothetical protein